MVGLHLAHTLENVVDNESPRNILKFRLACYPKSLDPVLKLLTKQTKNINLWVSTYLVVFLDFQTPSYLLIHIYVEDLNDHAVKLFKLIVCNLL